LVMKLGGAEIMYWYSAIYQVDPPRNDPPPRRPTTTHQRVPNRAPLDSSRRLEHSTHKKFVFRISGCRDTQRCRIFTRILHASRSHPPTHDGQRQHQSLFPHHPRWRRFCTCTLWIKFSVQEARCEEVSSGDPEPASRACCACAHLRPSGH
jgi:hypothetical protein